MTLFDLNKKTIEKIIGKKYSDSELHEKISMFGTPVEDITKEEIKIDVTPNRPDLLSDQGFIRAFSSYLGKNTGLKKYLVKKSGMKLIVEDSVSKVRPYTACAIVKNLNFNDEKIKEIIKIQEKLHITYGRNRKRCAIGVYPLEKIEFPIKFLAKKPEEITFIPLESKYKMNGKEILSEHPTGKEYKQLLEKEMIYPVFIDNKNKVLSMPPIINSHEIGKITEKTKEVFIECSGFDLEVLKKCLNMIVCSLADMGGNIYSIEMQYGKKKIITPDLNPEKMKLKIEYVNKRVGLNLKERELKTFLEKMGFDYDIKKEEVSIPPYRTDILHPIDFIEDVAIAYGYNNFKEEIPQVATIGEQNHFEKIKNKLANICVSVGLIEMNSTTIINKENQTYKMLSKHKPIVLYNSLNIDFNSLRSNILVNLLQSLKNNKTNEYPQRIFEIGSVFSWDDSKISETKIKENTNLAIVLCGKEIGFTEIRQILDRIMKLIAINIRIEEGKINTFIDGRCGIIYANNKEIGHIGEINPEVLSNFELEMPVSALEIDLNKLFEEIKK